MQDTLDSLHALQQGPALLQDLSKLLSDWDSSRSMTDLIATINERFQPEISGNGITGRRRRGKCMSRRPGQDGSKEFKEGGWWKFRMWVDLPGQIKRAHPSISICPVKGPGSMTSTERQARKREIIADRTGRNKEVVVSESAITFEMQGQIMLDNLRKRRREPVAEGTLLLYDQGLRLYLNPILGKHPISEIYNPQLKLVVDSLVAKGLAPKTIVNVVSIAKAVIASAVDLRTGEALYPRTWKAELIDSPMVDPDEQNTPAFSRENLTELADYHEPRMRMLFILAGATGARIAELLGLEIDKHISADFRTITICQQGIGSRIVVRVKQRSSRRDVDLHPDIAAVLKSFLGDRTSGFVFTTRNNTPIAYNKALSHLHTALRAIGYVNPLAENKLAGTHAFRRSRDTFLRNETDCPEGIYKFWLGHAVGNDMSALYDKIKRDRKKRLEWATRCGYGFDLPPAVLLYGEQGMVEEAA